MTCEKTRFASESAARSATKHTPNNNGDRWRAYLCPDCGGYHLTTQPNTHKTLAPPPATNRRVHGRGPRARTLEELEALAKKMRQPRKLEED